MDRNQVSTEYWKSRPLMQIPQSEVKSGNHLPQTDIANEPHGVDTILRGLFKKANPEELHTLYGILTDNRPATDQGLVTQLLDQEIHKRPR